jgi:hypothetical protein
MKLNRTVALVVILAVTWTAIPARAEDREGVLMPRQTVSYSETCDVRPVRSSNRQLAQAPGPVTRVPGVPLSPNALKRIGIGIASIVGSAMVFV